MQRLVPSLRSKSESHPVACELKSSAHEKMRPGLIVFMLIAILISACRPANPRETINIRAEQSAKFSADEIDNAVTSVIDKFSQDFHGCKLTDLWYDAKLSDLEAKGYTLNGRGSVNRVSESNVIVLLSNFTVDAGGGDGSLKPNSTYSAWKWFLIRDSQNGKWSVDDWGY